MVNDVIKKIQPKMDLAITSLESELKNLRTGRANPAILEDIVVPYFGTQTPLKQMASITAPETSLIVVQPWDKSALADIENTLRNSDLKLSLANDGSVIRISFPPITGERREELIKLAKKYGEDARVSLRNIRGEAWDEVQKAFKNKEISEDEKYRGEKELNELIEKENKKVEAIIDTKVSDLGKI